MRDALVTVRGEDKEKSRLIAYAVREAGAALSIPELRQHLRKQLPDYMVPSGFVILDQIPLTVSGKVDRQALPDVDYENSDLAASYVGPRSETENVITQIWQQVLEVKKLGIHDNFFDLGGHSLLMVQVYNKLREAFHKDVPMVELFRNPTIATLSGYFSGDAATVPSLKENAGARQQARCSINPFQQLKNQIGINMTDLKDRSALPAIAVIGMSGIFPGAHNVEEFWQNLRDGVESISRFTDAELELNGDLPWPVIPAM